MTDWAAEVDRLLFDGEDVVESVDVGRDRLVVTTHRVLAFMPAGDGPRFEAIHLPNVTAVELESGGATNHLQRSAKAGVLGTFLLLGGVTVSFDGLFTGASVDASTAGQTGVGELVGLLGPLGVALALIDDLLLVGGLGALAVGALSVGLYWRSRHADVIVRVAGGDDLRLTGDDVTEASLVRLRRALGFE